MGKQRGSRETKHWKSESSLLKDILRANGEGQQEARISPQEALEKQSWEAIWSSLERKLEWNLALGTHWAMRNFNWWQNISTIVMRYSQNKADSPFGLGGYTWREAVTCELTHHTARPPPHRSASSSHFQEVPYLPGFPCS